MVHDVVAQGEVFGLTTALNGAPELAVGLEEAQELAGRQPERLGCCRVAAVSGSERVKNGREDDRVGWVALVDRECGSRSPLLEELRRKDRRVEIERHP